MHSYASIHKHDKVYHHRHPRDSHTSQLNPRSFIRVSCERLLRFTIPTESGASGRVLRWDFKKSWLAWLPSVGVEFIVPIMTRFRIMVVLLSCPLQGLHSADCGYEGYSGKGHPHEGVEGEGGVGMEGV